VFLRRQPHYAASAAITSAVLNGELKGICPAHAITTFYYLAKKHGSQSDAETAVDEVLRDFEIVSLEKADWHHARALTMPSFEDAAVAVTAEKAGAAFIITRNEADSAQSPVPAINSASFLIRFITKL